MNYKRDLSIFQQALDTSKDFGVSQVRLYFVKYSAAHTGSKCHTSKQIPETIHSRPARSMGEAAQGLIPTLHPGFFLLYQASRRRSSDPTVLHRELGFRKSPIGLEGGAPFLPTSRLDGTSFPGALSILPHPSGSYAGSQDDDAQHSGWKDWWALSDLRSCLGQELRFWLRFYIRVLQKKNKPVGRISRKRFMTRN